MKSAAAFSAADCLLLLSGALGSHRAPAPPDAAAIRGSVAALGGREELADRIGACLADLAGTDGVIRTVEFNRLFAGPCACPANEAAYIRRDKGALLGDIAGFYRAFGIELRGDQHERADHLCCELEYLALVFTMLGNALSEGGEERAAVTIEAIRRFAGDHLGEWVATFAERLSFAAELGVYSRLGSLLGEVWKLLAARWDLPVPSGSALPSADAEPDESTWECLLPDQPTARA